MNILIGGASGFIGRALTVFLSQRGHQIYAASHRIGDPSEHISDRFLWQALPDTLAVDGVIQLAGAPIQKRWTPRYRQTLIDSRVGTTRTMVNWMGRAQTKPKFFLNASAVGYYGVHPTHTFSEQDPGSTEGFAPALCHQWEQEARRAVDWGIKTSVLRLGVVMGSDAQGCPQGMLAQVMPLFRWGICPQIGTGQQWLSWIHLRDVLESVAFLLEQHTWAEAYNLTAPEPVTQEQFNQVLAKQVAPHSLGLPMIFSVPATVFRLRYGAMADELLLHGQRVLPHALIQQGYHFRYPTLETALRAWRDQG